MSSQASMFPLRPSVSRPERDARTVDLFGPEGSEILEVLQAGTARELFAALADEPATTSDLADRVDTSIQNAHYHVERLEAAGLLEVIDTHYSSRGTEMKVYAPADDPLCLVCGDDRAKQITREHVGEPHSERPGEQAAVEPSD